MEKIRKNSLSFLKPFPTKIVCVGLNYHRHAKELGMETPRHPIIFLKPLTALIGPGESIVYPPFMAHRVDYEGELGVVIGKKCRNANVRGALDYVKGYLCVNDVTARDLQKLDGQWTRAKSFDTFCPVGPRIASAENLRDPNNVRIVTRLNGKVAQDDTTLDFIFNVQEVISFISRVMTLLPGDIISTGTPPGIGAMKKGDTVEVEIEGIGVLRNKVG
ncbi:fumarylacetoacetate hydrolase family protein [Candidatus Woesearchaeota archaeon]|nr:fumarylacetoacetate hydrolase family protein [Candidatus Woesearchaeota archaeon]